MCEIGNEVVEYDGDEAQKEWDEQDRHTILWDTPPVGTLLTMPLVEGLYLCVSRPTMRGIEIGLEQPGETPDDPNVVLLPLGRCRSWSEAVRQAGVIVQVVGTIEMVRKENESE